MAAEVVEVIFPAIHCPMEDATDHALIAAYRRGDAAALKPLVDRHLPALSGFCWQLMLNRTQAEDLAQETFLKALRSLDSYRGLSQFQTWLFAIASNLAKSRLTRGRREVAATQQLEQLSTRTDQTPDQIAMQSELAEEIQTALAELPLALRSAMVLMVVHGSSPEVIAEIEGCTVNTVYWRIHKARKLLKRRLQQWTT
jgi:RNA polymerase sigma-70 factor, ECF subfamily